MEKYNRAVEKIHDVISSLAFSNLENKKLLNLTKSLTSIKYNDLPRKIAREYEDIRTSIFKAREGLMELSKKKGDEYVLTKSEADEIGLPKIYCNILDTHEKLVAFNAVENFIQARQLIYNHY